MSTSRVLSALVALFALAGFVGAVLLPGVVPSVSPGALSLAQKKAKEEEEDDPPPKKKGKEEEEDPKQPTRKIEQPDDVKPPPPSSVVETPDLPRALAAAKHAEVAALYKSLLVPYDVVSVKNIQGIKLPPTFRVEPIPPFVGGGKRPSVDVMMVRIDEDGKPLAKAEPKAEKLPVNWIKSVAHYEDEAVVLVQAFLNRGLEQGDNLNARYLPRYDQYVAAEVALAAVLRFHQSAVERKARQGEGWGDVENRLRQQLLGVVLKRLDLVIAAKSWDAAFDLLRYSTDTFRRPAEQAALSKSVSSLMRQAMADPVFTQDRLKEAYRRLRQFAAEFPDSKVISPLEKSLEGQAKTLFEQARAASDAGKQAKDPTQRDRKRAEAVALIRQAEEIWPDLPGLQSYRVQLENAFQELRVAMRGSPKYFSPARATTEPELRAVDLLFESLVVCAPDAEGLSSYHSCLAEGRPVVVPQGREFRLPRHARWSDGKELRSTDVTFSIDEMREGRGTGRSRDWGAMLESPRSDSDASRVRLQVKQGFLDPLALASFRVVPHDREPDGPAFAEKPVGSGPFALVDTRSENGRTRTLFAANPHYGSRLERLGMPHVRELRFFRSEDPAKDLENKVVDLALDLTAKQAAELRKNPAYEVPLEGEKSVNRRVYFLAVNNRKTGLHLADMRLALALAIDREKLLDKHFREGLGRDAHRAINGPYPARSWARNPKFTSRDDARSLDPHDAPRAKALAGQALKALGQKEVTFTLKYPAGDKALASAMAELCESVSAALPGVKLTAEDRDPYALREDVEATQAYDLAYAHYDFPDESYWLMPLLGPGGKNGTNALRYHGKMVTKVQQATNVRHFADVRRHAHALHQMHLEEEMPFVPLWQLTPLHAFRKGRLETPPYEAYRMFARVEQWKVR